MRIRNPDHGGCRRQHRNKLFARAQDAPELVQTKTSCQGHSFTEELNKIFIPRQKIIIIFVSFKVYSTMKPSFSNLRTNIRACLEEIT